MADGQVLAGRPEDHFLVGDGAGPWARLGPGIRAAAVAAHPDLDGHWLGGAYPGGLWMTENGGTGWRQCGSFTNIMAIRAEGSR